MRKRVSRRVARRFIKRTLDRFGYNAHDWTEIDVANVESLLGRHYFSTHARNGAERYILSVAIVLDLKKIVHPVGALDIRADGIYRFDGKEWKKLQVTFDSTYRSSYTHTTTTGIHTTGTFVVPTTTNGTT